MGHGVAQLGERLLDRGDDGGVEVGAGTGGVAIGEVVVNGPDGNASGACDSGGGEGDVEEGATELEGVAVVEFGGCVGGELDLVEERAVGGGEVGGGPPAGGRGAEFEVSSGDAVVFEGDGAVAPAEGVGLAVGEFEGSALVGA